MSYERCIQIKSKTELGLSAAFLLGHFFRKCLKSEVHYNNLTPNELHARPLPNRRVSEAINSPSIFIAKFGLILTIILLSNNDHLKLSCIMTNFAFIAASFVGAVFARTPCNYNMR